MTISTADVTTAITHRQRVLKALRHEQPDRQPVDFLATPEIWDRLKEHFDIDMAPPTDDEFFDPNWEAVQQKFEIDCRVISYDQFCSPPDSAILPGAKIDWWNARSRSTPNRMFRQALPDGSFRDIWGHVIGIVYNQSGSYEEFSKWPLSWANSVEDLKDHPWPDPDWWDFSTLPDLMRQYDEMGDYHLRFRIGSVYEIAWQIRGMQEFLVDLAKQPEIPQYIMERLTEIYVENTRRVLEIAGDRLDMVYLYDDVATQNSLMISKRMWQKYVKPCHERIFAVAKEFGKPIMYHCDGALYPLLPELIELGIDVLNPVQADAAGMEPQRLKDEFGDRISFHGGIDIIKTLPRGTEEDVRNEVRDRIRVLGKNGGYVLCSSHHIQSDTPLANVFAMYDMEHRYLHN